MVKGIVMFRQQNRFSFVFALCAIIAASAASAVEVSTVEGLEAAVKDKNTPITLKEGGYALTKTLVLDGIVLVGETDNPRDTVIYGDGTFRTVEFNNTAALYNLTVSNGYYVASGSSASTAGVYGKGRSKNILSNCVVTACQIGLNGTNGGKGAAVRGCTLYDCVICGNTATGWKDIQGAGLADCTAYDTEIFGNSAESAGGAVDSTLYRCLVYGNEATNNGGGAAGCTIYEQTIISNNTANCGGGTYQGTAYDAIICNNASKTYGGGARQGSFYRCCIYGNTAGTDGGGVSGDTASTNPAKVYEHTVVSNNVCKRYGGGMFGSYAYDSEICMNMASDTGSQTPSGGGVANCSVSNCTIRGNACAYVGSKKGYGGAAYQSTLRKCIVRDNFVDRGYASAMLEGAAYDCFFTNNCSSADVAKTLGAFRKTYLENCTCHGGSVDYGGCCVNCRFMGPQVFRLESGANVLAEGNYSSPGYIFLTSGSSADSFAMTNCLITGSVSSSYLFAKSDADTVSLVNCTIVDNSTRTTFRANGVLSETAKPAEIVNCAFPRNYNQSMARLDFFIDTEGVKRLAMTNCLFGPNKTNKSPEIESGSVNNVADMKFDTENAADPYSLQRKSPAIGQGLYQDWMASATDLKGDPRAQEDGTVAIGCYECWLPASGLMLLLR